MHLIFKIVLSVCIVYCSTPVVWCANIDIGHGFALTRNDKDLYIFASSTLASQRILTPLRHKFSDYFACDFLVWTHLCMIMHSEMLSIYYRSICDQHTWSCHDCLVFDHLNPSDTSRQESNDQCLLLKMKTRKLWSCHCSSVLFCSVSFFHILMTSKPKSR